MKQVSFDFDCTLSRKDVQDYAKSLIAKGYEVWILTSRFDDHSRYNDFRMTSKCNDDLFKIAEELGIPKERIIFGCFKDKWEIIKEMKGFDPVFHLDDDYIEINGINRHTWTKGVSVISSKYKNKCNKTLGDDEKIVAH
jgi:hypothetical protein